MSITVTATQGGSVAVGMNLMVKVLTGFAVSPIGAVHGVGGSPANTVPSDTITPVAAGSYIYGAILAGNIVFSALSGTTFQSNINNNGLRYITLRSTAVTPSTSPLTLGASQVTNGISVSLLEILAGSGLTETAGGNASTAVATTVTTGSFSPSTGALLVATLACNGSGSGGGTTTMTVSDSSAQTWTEQVKQNGSSHAYSGVWTAVIAPPASGTGLLSFFGE
jgi:hypothetical protein